MRRTLAALVVLASAACDRPSQHVYRSPAPPAASTSATAATPSTPELPLGTLGPGARLVAVTDAATGIPVALGSIADSVDVLTLVTFGPADWLAREGGRVELTLLGPSLDTTYVRPLGTPASIIAAQTFRLSGLKVGLYKTVVRLRGTAGRMIAESIPLVLEVVAH